MKKQDAIAGLPKRLQEAVAKLERRVPYIIDWHGTDILIQITHFYKKGIHFKPLSITTGYRWPNRQGTIDYVQVIKHNFRKAKLDDLPLYMGEGTQYYAEYFSDVKVFKKNHGHDLQKGVL